MALAIAWAFDGQKKIAEPELFLPEHMGHFWDENFTLNQT